MGLWVYTYVWYYCVCWCCVCVCVCVTSFSLLAPTNLSVGRPLDTEPLLEQKVPESFVKLQDIVRRLAQNCSQQNRAPVLTRLEYM